MIPNELLEQYRSNMITGKEIGALIQKSESTILRYLRKYNVQRYYEDKDWLKQKIEVEGLSPARVAKQANCDLKTIHKYMQKYKLQKKVRRKYHCNEHFFDVIDTEEKAYWLGFLYADGGLTYSKGQNRIRVQLNINDSAHLEKLNMSLSSNAKIVYGQDYDPRTGKNNKYAVLKIYSKWMCESLMHLGYVPSNNSANTVPHMNEEFIPAFIRGLFDGDGCFSYEVSSKGLPSFNIVGGKEVIDFVSRYLKYKLNINVQNKFERNMYWLDVSGFASVYSIMELLYNQATVYLDRKYSKYMTWKDCMQRFGKLQVKDIV